MRVLKAPLILNAQGVEENFHHLYRAKQVRWDENPPPPWNPLLDCRHLVISQLFALSSFIVFPFKKNEEMRPYDTSQISWRDAIVIANERNALHTDFMIHSTHYHSFHQSLRYLL